MRTRGVVKIFSNYRRQFLGYLMGLFGASHFGLNYVRRNKQKMVKQVGNHKNLAGVLTAREQHWVGNGFYVSTIFSMDNHLYPMITPFLLMDHAAPLHFPPSSQKRGVGEHPHRGFETVTFAISGEVEHRDSGGGGGTITAGGVQWMTAAAGVVHEEYFSKEFSAQGGNFEMIQLWVNLPAKDKMSLPRYQSLAANEFPRLDLAAGKIRAEIIAGELAGVRGPAKTFTVINIYKLQFTGAAELALKFSAGTNTLIFQISGHGEVQGQPLKARDLAIFDRDGESVVFSGSEGSQYLVLNGEPIDEPLAHYGPFVMNTQPEIAQAIKDFEAGKMGTLVREG